jgi:hypothetical protein
MVRYTLEQRVFLYVTHVKYGSARKCRRKLRRKFREERVPSRQTIHNFVNKRRTTGLLIDKKQKHKRRVLTAKLDNIGVDLNIHIENHRNVSLKRLECQSLVQERQHNCGSHPVKVDVWCAVSIRRIVLPVPLTKQLIAKNIYK